MSDITPLEFEKPIVELEKMLDNMKNHSNEHSIDVEQEVERLTKKLDQTRMEIYSNLSPWQRVQIARHQQRPYALDYIERISSEWIEVHGDRAYNDDRAIVGGFATVGEHKLVIVALQKGRSTKENIMRNFGCAHPEGYRKALRIMRLAHKFKLPLLCLIDTSGAYPGIASEERHVAEAIAVNIREMFGLEIPVFSVVIGEGGSGGAIGIGVSDRVAILENAYYSVISPEGCASILWKDRAYAEQAAEALKLSAQDLHKLNLVEEVVPEPQGGAHHDWDRTAEFLKESVIRNFDELKKIETDKLLEERYQRYRRCGEFTEATA